MDAQVQSFLELSAKDDLVQLIPDTRAAWLLSADGSRVLWANAAGAAFFATQSISDLHRLTTLERSPAKPHIARIASFGSTSKFSVDRLRFYRGLRVMLLTCQCKRVELENGEVAALIVCGDKEIALQKDPVRSFANILSADDVTVYLYSNGDIETRIGATSAAPNEINLHGAQNYYAGSLELENALHTGAVLKLSDRQHIAVMSNEPTAHVPATDEPEINTPIMVAEPPLGASISAPQEPTEFVAPTQDTLAQSDPTQNSAIGSQSEADFSGAQDATISSGELNPSPEDALANLGRADESKENAAINDVTEPLFVFEPRRRPVRFAWKMDAEQKFTFVSDEFAEVLGPDTTNIVGLTWHDVAAQFDLDPRGQISRALDRRDTWSGKTIDWPVTGAAIKVPVDMAALPAFDRHRNFEGYRGFGVCRAGDAVQDTDSSVFAAAALSASALPDNKTEELILTEEDIAENSSSPETSSAEERNDTSVENSSSQFSQDELDALPHLVDAQLAASQVRDVNAPQDEVASSDSSEIENISDLEPQKPDSLSGKTFLGASAAAIVGSFAKFTGKSHQKNLEDSSSSTGADVPSADASVTEDNVDAEVKEEELVSLETPPGAALDTKLAALESGDEGALEADLNTSENEDGMPVTDSQSSDLQTETEQVSDNQAADKSASLEVVDSSTEASLEHTAIDETSDESANDAASSNSAEDVVLSPSNTVAETVEEAIGVASSAELKPNEIEDAVKSLAQTYPSSENHELDLFDNENEGETSQISDDVTEPNEQDLARAVAQASEIESSDSVFNPATESEANSGADTHSIQDVPETISGSEPQAPEEISDLSGEPTTPLSLSEDDTSVDEKEFFEETAAFEEKDKIIEPPRTGEVIPLATARPRVVPVDTSGLSRPEREAFRKIAEALGARLEGDIEDFGAPETEPEPEEALIPDAPPTAPIDPSLLDRLPISIAIVHDREVLYANKAMMAMLGYRSLQELSEAGGLEALFIDETDELPEAQGMDVEVDEALKLRLANGGVLSVDAHMHSVPWNGSSGLMISITERKSQPAPQTAAPNFFADVRAELDAARNRIAELETILETATDGVLVLDQEDRIVTVNSSAEALFNANRADMIGKSLSLFLAPESQRAAKDYFEGLSQNGVASVLNDGREVLGKTPSGGLIPLFMTIGRIGGDDTGTNYCAVLRDITQWKTAEEELTDAKRQAEDANSAKSDFLAKISHEIRTPLNAIIGFSEVMMEERFGPIGNDRYKDYLKDIRTSGSHIMSLVNDLLDLSKIEAGKLDLQFGSVSANEVINECVALMQPQANRERVIIRASLPETVPDVVADPRSLRQIVLNLLSNAIKYNRPGGQVILSTALEDSGEVALRVRDTGTGMSEKQLTAALEPFRQVHTSSRGGGTGLGLPLTKALVEANRAAFQIESTQDQGTLVEILFPTQRVLSE